MQYLYSAFQPNSRSGAPCVTLSTKGICFNRICIQKLREIAFVELLVHSGTRRFQLNPPTAAGKRRQPDARRCERIYDRCLQSEEISGNRVYTNSGEPRYQDAYTASQPRGCQGRSPVVFCWQQKTKTPSAVLSDIFCENLNLKTIIGKNAAWNFLRRQVSLILHLSNPPAGSYFLRKSMHLWSGILIAATV